MAIVDWVVCATLDNLAAYRFRLFKRSNGDLCLFFNTFLSVVPKCLSIKDMANAEYCGLTPHNE